MIYDARCGVCSRLRSWMLGQSACVDLDFVPAGSARARTLFPELKHDDEPSELVVVTDEGDVYVDDAAWIVCLYALVEYREWSFRLSRRPLRSLARSAWLMLSANRRQLSEMLSLTSDEELRARLARESPPSCNMNEGAEA